MSNGVIMGNVLKLEVRDITVDLGNVTAATSAETDVTVDGLAVGDMVFVNKPSLEAGIGIVNCRVKAADTLAITTMNATAGAINEASETFKLLIVKASGQ